MEKVQKKRVVHLYDKLHERGPHCWNGRYYVKFPWLNVSGRWLMDAGFNVGDKVEISVEMGKLVITKSSGDGDR